MEIFWFAAPASDTRGWSPVLTHPFQDAEGDSVEDVRLEYAASYSTSSIETAGHVPVFQG